MEIKRIKNNHKSLESKIKELEKELHILETKSSIKKNEQTD